MNVNLPNPKMIYAKNMLANNAPPNLNVPCSTCFTFMNLKK